MSTFLQSLDNISDIIRKLRKLYKYRYFHSYWQAQERMAYEFSPDYLRSVQWKKFKEILEFAYNRIPFYRDRFRQASITPESIKKREDIVRIPILSKDDIRQNFPDRLLDSNCKHRLSMIRHTSGSTGESLHFLHPDEMWMRTGYDSVFLGARGVRRIPVWSLYSPLCTPDSCSVHDDGNGLKMMVNKLISSRLLWYLARYLEWPVSVPSSLNILCAPDEYMEIIAEMVSHFPTCIMQADPVYLGAFARYLRKNGTPIPKVLAVISGSELLTSSVRDLLREVFGCDVYDIYGATEVPDIAKECEYHKLHINMDLALVEVIRDGQPVEPGEMGKVVVTDLCNYNMPFIRYDLSDVTTARDGECRCGRNTDIIGPIEGRVSDTIVSNGSGLLTPWQVDQIFRGLHGIAAYRLIQKTRDSYHISIMKDDVSEEFDEQMLIKRCYSMFGDESQFDIECVNGIAPEPSMKFRFVYSEMPPPEL